MNAIHTFNARWAEQMLCQVEAEIRNRKRGTIPSKNTRLALEVHNLIRGAVEILKLFPAIPQTEHLISYRAGDTWKYQFAAPLLISPAAARWLYDGRGGREKAKDAFPGFKGKSDMVAVYGEHIWPTASMRTYLPWEMRVADERGSRRNLIDKFPNTHYSYEVLVNITSLIASSHMRWLTSIMKL